MQTLYKKFYHSLKWTSIESIAYQTILLIHHIFLFKYSSYELYGIVGAIFSVIYLVVTIIDFGLESSISPFFTQITKNKTAFKKFFWLHITPTFAFTAVAAISIFIAIQVGFTHKLASIITPVLFFLLIILALCESLKKTLRSFLHLAFLNYATTTIEVVSIIVYVSSIWIALLLGIQISVPVVFIPMVITSAASTIFLGFSMYGFYRLLPDKQANQLGYPFHVRVMKCRLFNTFNQLSHMLFSGNFLVPFFAIQFGLAQAGVFKLICHICYAITTILRKIFGWTSDALLAQTKSLTLLSKQTAFTLITEKLHHVLYGVFIFFLINHNKLLTYSKTHTATIPWPLIYFFIIITLSEMFFLPYEKFYIAEEKTFHIFLFNFISMLLFVGIISQAQQISQLCLLFLIVALRVILFGLLGLLSFYTWHIKPAWKLNPYYLATSAIITLFFFIVL